VHSWLQLRIEAWEQGLAFEDLLVTPHFLKQLGASWCPVSREALAGQARVVRLNQAAGYAAGNLAQVCERVAQVLPGITGASALAAAREAAASGDGLFRRLSAAEWERLASLILLATPQPHEEAARWPLRALPPNRVRVLNPIQGLQVWLTLQIELDGWSQRLNRLADRLPEASRLAFRVFVGGFCPASGKRPPDPCRGIEATPGGCLGRRTGAAPLAAVRAAIECRSDRTSALRSPVPGHQRAAAAATCRSRGHRWLGAGVRRQGRHRCARAGSVQTDAAQEGLDRIGVSAGLPSFLFTSAWVRSTGKTVALPPSAFTLSAKLRAWGQESARLVEQTSIIGAGALRRRP
jgi:hypothetical protein